MFRELCGERTLKNVVLVTTMWGEVTDEQGTARERLLRDEQFKYAVDRGAQLCRYDNTPESGRTVLRKILKSRASVVDIAEDQHGFGEPSTPNHFQPRPRHPIILIFTLSDVALQRAYPSTDLRPISATN